MRRFRGVPSEVLIMPLSVDGKLGDDITDVTNVKKYNKPISASLSGMARGSFPTNLIPKTDEPNFQTLNQEVFNFLRKTKFYSTVKADGSSGTMYRDGDHFGCCSRNLEMKEREENLLWKLAYRYDLKSKLPDKRAIQFEVVGPSIQSNKMKLIDHDLLLFNVWDIKNRGYLHSYDVINMADKLGIKHVDVIDWNADYKFQSDEELRKYAEGLYPNTKNQREGVVIRPMIEGRINSERVSFKVINLLYKE
jgi:RNA ligase (TIGR02306 family)